MWQLVLIAWGTKYGAGDINALVDAVRAQSSGPARVVLLTDRDRPGLGPGIETRAHPPEFLQPRMMTGGCQAKLVAHPAPRCLSRIASSAASDSFLL